MNVFQVQSLIARQKQGKGEVSLKRKIFLAFSAFSIAGLFFGFVFFLVLLAGLPDLSKIHQIVLSESSVIYDRNGVELYTIHGGENRTIVPRSDIPDSVVFATLAIEDEKFFEHGGFSVTGILRSLFSEVTNFGAHKSGGSTLTQQLVKNLFLTSEKTYTRKIKELILSLQIEWKFSKEEILGMYLNSIPYGSNAFGVEQASETFFGKSVRDLKLPGAVILAALPKAPSFYSPYGDHVHSTISLPEEDIKKLPVTTYAQFLREVGEDAITIGLLPTEFSLDNGATIIVPGRTSLVLDRMKEAKFVRPSEAEAAELILARFTFQKYKEDIKAPHFVLYVKDLLEKKYGKDFLNSGGLKIYTTLDYTLQQKAEEILAAQAVINQKTYGANNAAMMSVIPKTGEIVTMVGSKDYWDTETTDGNVNVLLQRRLPGSTFKPFVYAAAFASGFAPATVLFDVQTDFGNNYKPQNFDGHYRGPISMRKALGNSLNIPAIKAGILTGLPKVYHLAEAMGLSFLKDVDWYGGSFPLGVSEVRPIDMCQAYSVLANMGKKVELTPILTILDKNGNILEKLNVSEGTPVLDEETAYLVTNVLSDPNARGAGWNARLQLKGRQNAVKTGTSDKLVNNKPWPLDGWTIGYTPNYVTLAWVGNNDGSVMKQEGSGYSSVTPMWQKFMEELHKGVPAAEFTRPEGIKNVVVSLTSGKLPRDNFPRSLLVSDVFSSANMPTEYDTSIKFVTVDALSKELPNEFTPDSSKLQIPVVAWQSERPTDPNWENPVRMWAEKSSDAYFQALGIADVLSKAPTTSETLHTSQNTQDKPSVKITSPINNGQVNKTGVGVWVDVASKKGVVMVEYYLDGERVSVANKAPYKGKVVFPEGVKVGDTFTITAKVYDTLYNGTIDSVKVKIADDTTPPRTEIVYPKDKDTFPAGSVISVQTNTYDASGDISKVDFYLDGKKQGTTEESPYNSTMTLPQEPGKHVVKVIAFDKTSNTAEYSINISVGEKPTVDTLQLEIKNSATFGDSLPVKILLPSTALSQIKSLELIAKYKTEEGVKPDAVLMSIQSFDEKSSGVYTYLWVRPQIGEYEVQAKVSYTTGKVLFSPKHIVTIAE